MLPIMKWISIAALLLAVIWGSSESYQVPLGIAFCVVAILLVRVLFSIKNRINPRADNRSELKGRRPDSARSLVISMSWAVLAAPLIYAQDVKPSEASVIFQQPPVIELQLPPLRFLNFALHLDPVLAPVIKGHDLSRYREFQFGMNVDAVAKQAGRKPSEAKLIHARPAVIQELDWQASRFPGPSSDIDPVKSILFSFCNGELFRMVVNYDRYRTEGLTAEDMIEAISANYGNATTPDAEIIFPSVYNESVKVIARWEDAQYSFNLVRSSYQSSFGMVVFSKRLDALAQAAVTEAVRLNQQEAPQREIERNKREDDEKRAQQEKARRVNKPGFRP